MGGREEMKDSKDSKDFEGNMGVSEHEKWAARMDVKLIQNFIPGEQRRLLKQETSLQKKWTRDRDHELKTLRSWDSECYSHPRTGKWETIMMFSGKKKKSRWPWSRSLSGVSNILSQTYSL